jgi:hypothetical protein
VIGAIIAYFLASPKVHRIGSLQVLQSKAVTMQIPERIKSFHDEMTEWRRDIHAHPELGFEEHRTSEFVAGKLAEFGCEVIATLARPASLAFSRPATVHRSDCGRTWMRCRSARLTTFPIGQCTMGSC